MNQAVILLVRDDSLSQQLHDELGEQCELTRCESLTCLREHLPWVLAGGAVVVQLCPELLGDQSPGQFLGELRELSGAGPLVVLVDESCPVRQRRLVDKTADFCLTLPLNMAELRSALSDRVSPAEELEGFWQDLPHKELLGRTRSMVTFTPEMFGMIDELMIAAKHDVTVLLIGETGSGKTYLARLIHEISNRAQERLCVVSCGALPPDLIESELFGYVKGAFTGADSDKEGKFAAAGTGTLLLDEIDVLPLEQQAKLLRVIETNEYEPVGSNETRHNEARLIVASNYELEDLVHAGKFRTDLYYRLNILNFHLLPLRRRPWDIEYLARKFALEHSRTHNIPLREIEPGLIEALKAYSWPGNIRELENVMRRAVLYCQRGLLSVQDLPSSIRNVVSFPSRAPGALHAGNGNGNPAGAIAPLDGGRHGGFTGLHAPPVHVNEHFGHWGRNGEAAAHIEGNNGHGHAATLEARVDLLERRIIEDSLRRNNHRRKETASELGISRVTLYNKMKKFGLLE